MQRLNLFDVSFVIALLAGCASSAGTAKPATNRAASTTTFVSSWKSPTAQPLRLKGAKVAAVVLMSDVAARRTAEDKLAKEISERGAIGVPMYALVEQFDATAEPLARDALERADVQGVVVLHPTGTALEPKSDAEYNAEPYNRYWSGYYVYGWASPWTAPENETFDTVVSVQTLIYSLKQNQLVWAGTSKTTNPPSLDHLITELASATASELGHMDLVASQ